MKKIHLIHGLAIWILLAIGLSIYWPGLSGHLLLDDEANLSPLADIENWADIGQFITESVTTNLGRPLSLASFVLQAHQWPFGIWEFKYTNVLIHLLNASLVAWLIWLLTHWTPLSQPRRLLLTTLTFTLWCLHPLQVSTVLYVVQRMTEFATLFTLLGLITYLKGRQLNLDTPHSYRGWLLMSLGIGLGGILATLSKENGILLILYVLVIELTLLPSRSRAWHRWATVFLYAPLTILITYFALHMPQFLASYAIRDFTLVERLLTETRILFDYLGKLILLKQDFGLFFDDYPISHSLLNPPTTLLTTLLILAAPPLALKFRKRWPLLSFAILWFLAGHLLESTFIALVPYFEHRNYLPILGPLLALSCGLLALPGYFSSSLLRKITISLIAMGILSVPVLTWLQTSLWGQPLVQAIWWADQKPLSRFAQSHAAQFFDKIEDPKTVEDYYQHMVVNFPQDIGPYLLLTNLACRYPKKVEFPNWPTVTERIRTGNLDTAAISALRGIIYSVTYHRCQLTIPELEAVFQLLLNKKPAHPNYYLDYVYFLYATFWAQQREYEKAVQWLEQSLQLKPNQPRLRLRQIDWSLEYGQLQQAQFYLDKAQATFTPLQKKLYAQRLTELSSAIQQAASASP